MEYKHKTIIQKYKINHRSTRGDQNIRLRYVIKIRNVTRKFSGEGWEWGRGSGENFMKFYNKFS